MTRTKILVVEDEAVVARDLERSLTDLGYDVIDSVGSRRRGAARRPKSAGRTSCCSTSACSGDIDGIEVAELLRERYRVPVVYLTAYSDDDTLWRAARSEPYGYLVKPFTSREVRSAVEIARYKHAMDARLAARELWFSTTLRSIGDAVVACTPGRRVQFMNRAAEELTGWSESEAEGLPIEEVVQLVAPGVPISSGDLISDVLARRAPRSLLESDQLLRRGGRELRTIESTAAPIVSDGALLGVALVMRDVTEQRRLKDKLVISERLSALGVLAAGICHEINNPLTFIVANVHVLENAVAGWREQLSDQGSIELAGRTLHAEEALSDLRKGAERIRRIVADLGAFGRQSDEPRAAIDVRESIEWSLRVAAAQLRPRARVVRDLRPVPPVRASDTKLAQVLINLLVNAAQAIPEGDPQRHTVRVATDTDPSGRVLISVQDSGSGIAPEVLAQIFDPFFTTKHPGVGVGLGLSICHSIVQSFGGELTVQSQEGRGTVFTVALPQAATLSGTMTTLVDEDTLGMMERARILVVDDELGVLRAVKALLGEEHDVTTSSDAREALDLFERGETFDVVLCDMMMNGWNGMDLYERVRARFPAMADRFVFATGGAFTPRTIGFLRGGAQRAPPETVRIRRTAPPPAPHPSPKTLVERGGDSPLSATMRICRRLRAALDRAGLRSMQRASLEHPRSLRRSIRKLSPFFVRHRARLVATLSLAVLAAVVGALEPLVIKRLFDTFVSGKHFGAAGMAARAAGGDAPCGRVVWRR